MRLFLLPISNKRTLIFCKRLNRQLTSEQTYVEKGTARASTTWLKWEEAGGGWKKQLTHWGNQLFKRIPFEEWGLKSIPPLTARRSPEDIEAQEETEVIYPSSVIKPAGIFDLLQQLATERQALHRKYMYLSIVGMPITIPFGLIPILPNIPFFYLVFRAWSHWRALSGSKHLAYLLEHGLIKSTPSKYLSEFYANQVRNPIQKLVTDNLAASKALEKDVAHLLDFLPITDGKIEADEQLEPRTQAAEALRTTMEEVIRINQMTALKLGTLLEVLDFRIREPIEIENSKRQIPEEKAREDLMKLKDDRREIQRMLRSITKDKTLEAMKTIDKRISLSLSLLSKPDLKQPPLTASPVQLDDVDEMLLLKRGSGYEIASILEEYEGAAELVVEVERATEQVEKSVAAKAELETERKDLQLEIKAPNDDVTPK